MNSKVVKSVGRVFEVFELFKSKQSALSVGEISKELNYPHSSTLSILKSMELLGYVNCIGRYDYFPSPKLYALISWLSESVESETEILDFIKDLHQETCETVNLSILTGDYVKILFGHIGTHAITINVREGTLMPANASFVGLSALSLLPDHEVTSRVNALAENVNTYALNIGDVRKTIQKIREDVISSGYDLFIPGIGAITIPIQSQKSGQVYIVGVVGPTDRLKEKEERHKVLIKELLHKHRVHLVTASSQ